MGIIDFELLTWNNLFSSALLTVLFFAVAATVIVALRPWLFWPLLLSSVIVGNLPKLGGYILVDEILLGAIVLGGLLVISVRKMRSQRIGRVDFHTLLFLLWMAYLIFQTFRGMEVTGDSRLVRWIYLYGVLALGVYLISTLEFQVRSMRPVLIIAMLSTVLMFAVYLGQGVYFQSTLGLHGRFLSQDQYVAGPSYAVFPIIVALPSAIMLLKDPSQKVRLLAWLTFAISMAVAYYFQTRIGWLVLAAFVMVSVPRLGLVRMGLLAAICFGLAFLFFPHPRESLPAFGANLYRTTNALWNPAKSDVGRSLDLRAGITTANQSTSSMFFGYGINAHKFVIVPELLDLRAQFMPELDFVIPGTRDDSNAIIFRTTGFTALLLDTGWIGIMLWLANVALVGRKVVISQTNGKLLLLTMLFISIMWPMSNNIWDIVLLYLLIMPRGIIVTLANYGSIYTSTKVSGLQAPRLASSLDQKAT